MALAPEILERARRIALENAVAHGGEARGGPILSRLLATDPSARSMKAELASVVEGVARDVTAMSADAQGAELERLGGPEPARNATAHRAEGELPPLPGAVEGSVVLRLAPFPSGRLHIGNARMLFINDYYRRLYQGKLLLVFDDTVGSEEKRVVPEMFQGIQDDLALSGVPPDSVYYKSDRLPLFYEWADRVIGKGAAYICHCRPEVLRANRAAGIPCRERAQAIGETQDGFRKMLDGGYATGEAVLRLRTDLADPDPAFRDRVLFRLSDLDHPRVGRKYRVWPMLEFSWAVDDVALGVTHVLRGKDLVIEDRMETFLWSVLGITGPRFVHWGILRLKDVELSKSKGYAEIRSGVLTGWDDPRTWSILALDRRGISGDALRRFTLSFGVSLSDVEVPAETLYAENRKIIDASAVRRSFVADPVRMDVEGFPSDLAEVSLSNHPDRPEMGRRSASAGPRFYLARADLAPRTGSEVRLKDLANVLLPSEIPASGSGPVSASFSGRENKKIPRLQWVGATGAVPVDLLMADGSHRTGLAESALRAAAPGEILQFERVGFVRVERTWRAGSEPIRVVFGHA